MFNKKAQAVGVSPLKMLVSFFIIIILILIMFLSVKFLVDNDVEKSEMIANNIFHEQLWWMMENSEVEGMFFPDFLESYSKVQLDALLTSNVFHKNIADLCSSVMDSFLPRHIFVYSSTSFTPFDMVYKGREIRVFGCQVDVDSDLKQETLIDALSSLGFNDKGNRLIRVYYDEFRFDFVASVKNDDE